MFTFEDAVEEYMTKLPVGILKRYQDNMYSDVRPCFCPYCNWYYPHDNWQSNKCPRCGSTDFVRQDNSIPKFGLFA